MVFFTLKAKSWCAHPSVSFNTWNSWPSHANSFCTTRSLVKPVIRHLTNAVQMNKGCDHHQHMEDLMALELKEWNRRNISLIEWLILLIVIKFVFTSLKEWRSRQSSGLCGRTPKAFWLAFGDLWACIWGSVAKVRRSGESTGLPPIWPGFESRLCGC